MTTPTLIEMIQAARDVDMEFLKDLPAQIRVTYRSGSNEQHDRLAPALICAVEALEEVQHEVNCSAGAKGTSRFNWDETRCDCQKKYAVEALTRIREMLEGKEPKV